LALVPRPGPDAVRAAAALFDGVDVVVVAGGTQARSARRLVARARHRGGVLVAEGRWPGADVELSCTPGAWDGIDHTGYGYLSARAVRVRGRSRWSASPVERTLLLPGPAGRVAAGEQALRLEVAG
ncbi:MAG: hypothetical protein ACRDQB_15060, partial [Thermocrispum sp.]